VSNNSQAAVAAYVDAGGLQLDAIVGRTSPDPALLKPSPFLVFRAIEALRVTAAEAVLLGDSPSDVDAARQAGTATVGYANKPGKRERLMAADAQVVVDDLNDVVAALRVATDAPASRVRR